MPLPWNQLFVLRQIVASDQPLSGSDLNGLLSWIGRSSIYAALDSLVQSGHITQGWDLSGRRPRRVFSATELGQQAIEEAGMGTFKVGEQVEVRLPANFLNLSGIVSESGMKATDYISMGDDGPWYEGIVRAARPDGDYTVEVLEPPVDNMKFVAVSPKRLRTPREHAD